MVNSSEIPNSYTTQWNVGTRQPASRTQTSRRQSQPRYNSSCSNCRRSRVKCSGGRPCQRCEALLNASTCIYELSQRRGKHKAASGGPEVEQGVTQDAFTTSPMVEYPSSDFLSCQAMLDDALSLPDLWQSTTEQGKGLEAFAHATPSTTSSNSVGLNDPIVFPKNSASSLDVLNHFPSPPLASSSSLSIYDGCDGIFDWDQETLKPCNCYLTHQRLVHRLSLAMKDLGTTSLDRILLLMQEVSKHAADYMACRTCDGGCPRLVNLAMLHQSQVGLLSDMAKSPAACGRLQGPEAVRFTLGAYRVSEQDDLDYKRLTILATVRKTKSLVASFDDLIRSSQDMEVTSDSEMPETTRINLRWLLDVAKSLKGRLKTIIAMLEKPDGAAKTS